MKERCAEAAGKKSRVDNEGWSNGGWGIGGSGNGVGVDTTVFRRDSQVADAVTGQLAVHLLLGNLAMTDEMLALVLKCNSRQVLAHCKHRHDLQHDYRVRYTCPCQSHQFAVWWLARREEALCV